MDMQEASWWSKSRGQVSPIMAELETTSDRTEWAVVQLGKEKPEADLLIVLDWTG